MHRTQLYIDEPLMQLLTALGKRRGTTVSELVRKALNTVYGKQLHEHAAIGALSACRGLWSDHPLLSDPQKYIRGFRKGQRFDRLRSIKTP